MSSIKDIVSLLDHELQQLVTSYENQIIELKKRITFQEDTIEDLRTKSKRLEADIDLLSGENRKLLKQLSQINKHNIEFLDLSIGKNEDYAIIDELFLSSTVEDSLLMRRGTRRRKCCDLLMK